MQLNKILGQLIQIIIYASGVTSALIVCLIVIFLFREGAGLFSRIPLTETFAVAVHSDNPISVLEPLEIRQVIEKDLTKWSQTTEWEHPVELLTMDEIGEYFTEEELGADFEFLNQRIAEFLTTRKGALAILPKDYLPQNAKFVDIDKVSLQTFVTGKDWYPTAMPSPQLGVLPIILGTMWVTFGAGLIALPIGVAIAIYLAEVAHKRIRSIVKPIIELLAGIPSIVYGFFGLVVLVPLIQSWFNLPVGETALTGSIILAFMALPTVITLSEDAIRSTPIELKEASLALGANRWQSIVRIILPYASSGITAACILGLGRAFGETMAVLMVTGNAAVMPQSFLQPVRTITATIAAELGEAPQGGIHYEALFALGSILFLFTFLINLTSSLLAAKQKG